MNFCERNFQVEEKPEEASLEENAFKWMFHSGEIGHLKEQCVEYMNESEEKMVR